jgi:hypothetical protein
MLRNTLNTFMTATLIMLLGVSSTAQAIVPMGDLMGSSSVTFTGQAKSPEASTALTIKLAPNAPTIKEHGDTEDREVEGNKVTVTYTITSRANGPDDYYVAAELFDGEVAGLKMLVDGLSTHILDAGDGAITAPMNLGATAAISSNGNVITVPYDKTGGADSVNGIRAGETVFIGDTEYTVGGVSNTEDLSTITLEGDAPASLALGTPIAERETFKVVVSGDALLDPAEEVTFTLDVTVGPATPTEGLTGEARLTHTIDAVEILPSFDRYVRNLNNDRNPAVEGEGMEAQYQDNWYFKQDVSAEEGDKVQILIVMNAGNLADQTPIVLHETLSPFVTYVAESAQLTGGGLVEVGAIADNEDGTSPVLGGDWTVGDGLEGMLFTLPKNTSAHLTYKVKVMGGAGEVEPVDSAGAGEDKEAGASVAGGESIYDTFPYGTPWRTVVDAGEQENPDLQACWCKGAGGDAPYCFDERGWTVGPNGLGSFSYARRGANTAWQPPGHESWYESWGCVSK